MARKGPILVAAFEPFGGRKRNRSWEVVRRLVVEGGVERILLPVDFAKLAPAIREASARSPRALLLVGEMPSGPLRVEGIAVNVRHSERPDNAGMTVQGAPVVPNAAVALRTRWDPLQVAEAIRLAGIPAVPSFHAGTYVCNAALFLALLQLPTRVPVGFLHVPRHGEPGGSRLGELGRAVEVSLERLTRG